MKIFKYAAVAAAGLMTMVSCSEDQSTFNVQDVPGRCLIEGVVKYNEGTTLEEGHFTYNYKPAANLELTVTITNSEYGNLSGKSTFTTITDAEGKYSIEIPAPAKNASVSITTADFRGVRTYITEENNNIVTKTEDVIYRGQTQTSVHSQGIVYANIVCTECSVNNPIDGMTQLATVKGKIGQGVEYKDAAKRLVNEDGDFTGYSSAKVYYVYNGAKADMIVRVNYEGSTFTYNVTSSATGEWTLQVPVYEFPANFTYELIAMPYNSSYTHYVAEEKTYTVKYNGNEIERTYTDYKGEKLEGYYSQSFQASYGASFPVSTEICSSESKIMVFKALNNGQDTYNYNSGVYTQNGLWYEELIEQLTKE